MFPHMEVSGAGGGDGHTTGSVEAPDNHLSPRRNGTRKNTREIPHHPKLSLSASIVAGATPDGGGAGTVSAGMLPAWSAVAGLSVQWTKHTSVDGGQYEEGWAASVGAKAWGSFWLCFSPRRAPRLLSVHVLYM